MPLESQQSTMAGSSFSAAQVLDLLRRCDSMAMKGDYFQNLVRDILMKKRPELKIEVTAFEVLHVRNGNNE